MAEEAPQLQSTFQKMPFMYGKERAIIISSSPCLPAFITPHAQRERGKVIGCGVHMFVNEKNI